MKKKGIPSEVLCLFFIVMTAILFGKILVDVKNVFDPNLKDEIYDSKLEYHPYSHRENSRIEKVKDMTIIRNVDDLKYYKNVLREVNITIKWLNDRLKKYDEEFFEENTLVVLSLVNDNNVTSLRINNIYKRKDEVIIELNKTIKDYKATSKYTWFSVIEIADKDDEIVLDIEKN